MNPTAHLATNLAANLTENLTATTLQEILEELYTLRRFHASAGLHRIDAILQALGSPQNRFPSLHIAGTNGKGTVSSVIASVLTEAGYKVGLYTSPHILRFNERIRVSGQEISNEALLEQVRRVLPLVLEENGTFFEAATALAFSHFADSAVDIAVIETGLGGRLDATNILSAKNVLSCAVTSIDYDHTEYLGDTLEQIASEKAGIMKHGTPCIVAEPRPELLPIFENFAARAGANIILPQNSWNVAIECFSEDFVMDIALSPQHTQKPEILIKSRLCGRHQAQNILTAFSVLEQIQDRFPTSRENFSQGVRNVSTNAGLRGRIELLQSSPPIVMDVAHNPAGLAKLIETLNLCGYAGIRWNVLFAAMQDKNLAEMLGTLAPICSALHLPELTFSRARQAGDIAQAALEEGFEAFTYSSVAEACSELTSKGSPLLIAGSFHLAEEVLLWWENQRKI